MPPRGKQSTDSTPTDNTSDVAGKDLGQSEVQQAFDEAQEKGYFGQEVDPLPNSAHSLESGPDSPTVEEQRAALAQAEAGTAKGGDGE